MSEENTVYSNGERTMRANHCVTMCIRFGSLDIYERKDRIYIYIYIMYMKDLELGPLLKSSSSSSSSP